MFASSILCRFSINFRILLHFDFTFFTSSIFVSFINHPNFYFFIIFYLFFYFFLLFLPPGFSWGTWSHGRLGLGLTPFISASGYHSLTKLKICFLNFYHEHYLHSFSKNFSLFFFMKKRTSCCTVQYSTVILLIL